MKTIPEEIVGKTWQEVADFSPPERFLDRIASLQTSKQPYVAKYVANALMEEDEGEDALELTENQKGFLYLLLKTVIDVLDQKGIG
jgi:hypothetical protein